MGLSVQPYGNMVIVGRLPSETRSPGGIVIPDVSQERADRAIVLAVGGGLRLADGTLDKPEVRVGDVVLIQPDAGTEITVDGIGVTVVKGDDVGCVIQEEAA